jgi:hypothetical protein
MALEQRISSLQKRHTEIDLKILAETARPAPDVTLLHQLKREKLGLKDSIEKLISGYKEAA